MTIPRYAGDNSFAHATRSDAEIWAELVEELCWDIALGPNEIGINVQGGEVTLTGSINVSTSKWAAQEAAYRVDGVRAVTNHIVVYSSSSMHRQGPPFAPLSLPAASPALPAEPLVARWRTVRLRGLAGMAFGVVTMLTPRPSIASLALSFGAYAFVDGVSALLESVSTRTPSSSRRFLACQGSLGVAAAAIMVVWPPIEPLVFAYVVVEWAQLTGILELAMAGRLPLRQDPGGWLLVSRGVLSLAIGVALVLAPRAGALALTFWGGAYALVSGGLLVVGASLNLRAWGKPSARLP